MVPMARCDPLPVLLWPVQSEPTAGGLLRYRLGNTKGEDIPGLFYSKPPVAICAHMYQ